jgi:hypothetical protein
MWASAILVDHLTSMSPILKTFQSICVSCRSIGIQYPTTFLFSLDISAIWTYIRSMLDSGKLGSEQMSLFSREWRIRSDLSTQVTCECIFDLLSDNYLVGVCLRKLNPLSKDGVSDPVNWLIGTFISSFLFGVWRLFLFERKSALSYPVILLLSKDLTK